MNKLRGKVKDAVKNKEKEKQLLIDNIKSIKKQLKVYILKISRPIGYIPFIVRQCSRSFANNNSGTKKQKFNEFFHLWCFPSKKVL